MTKPLLSVWFRREIERNALWLFLVFLLLQAVYSVDALHTRGRQQSEFMESYAESLDAAIRHGNRPLIESLLRVGLRSLNARTILLCRGPNLEVDFPHGLASCAVPTISQQGLPSYKWQVRNIDREGRFQLRVHAPLIAEFGILLWSLALSLLLACGGMFLIGRAIRRLREDVILPITAGMDLDRELPVQELEDMRMNNLEWIRLKSKQAASEAIVQVSRQVAHDIRSPLAALTVLLKEVKGVPEDDRIISRMAINRIQDIANNLIERNREFKSTGLEASLSAGIATEPQSVQLLSSLMEPLISEKRTQFRGKSSIEIDGRMDASCYGLFARIQPIEFKRVLSNLINNSVEALGERGAVTVTLFGQGEQIKIRVTDNGKGIPPEILVKLGQQGQTHGKVGGSGLGLFHARKSFEGWGGGLLIESEVGKGTSVVLTLPSVASPSWFVSELTLTSHATIVVLDDDESIHRVWQGRFDSLRVKDRGVAVVHLSNPEEFRSWVDDHSAVAKTAIYLVDYELIGFKETGLDLIGAFNLGARSILVTSRFEEAPVQEGCRLLGTRLIPKGMAGVVPISFEVPLERPDYVLIDDDNLVHMSWKYAAKKAGKVVLMFQSPEDFLSRASSLHKATPIYVDSFLGDDVRGEIFAKRLFEMGFRELWLCTGFPPDGFDQMTYFKGIAPKDPPWALLSK